MSFLDLDPTATANLMDRARMEPLDPETLKPGWFAGTWKAPFTGLASAVTDVTLLAGDAAPTALRPAARAIDTLFGTRSEEAVNRIPEFGLAATQFTAPDPRTTGIVGQAVHGLFNIAPQLVGGPELPAVLQGYKAFRLGMADGLDPGTALGVGGINAISTWVGLKIPLSVAPTMGVAGTVGTGAIGNLGTGMATRGATGALLEARGYPDMAAQYQVLDKNAIAVDLLLGGGFGAVAHYGPKAWEAYQTKARERQVEALLSDIDTALGMNNALHAELDTAPGIPATPAARAAHNEALAKALDDLINDRPVEVPPAVAEADFLENPTATSTRRAIVEAVEEHLGADWQQLKAELQARNLPDDTTLYQITRTPADQMAPVRPTAELGGLVDRALRENWEAGRLVDEIDGLVARMREASAEKAAARAEAGRARGALWIKERLTRAERNGELSPEAVRLANWLLEKNPNLADDLGVSFSKDGASGNAGEAGSYNPIERVFRIVKGRANDQTAAHEILHHAERMMPEDVRAGIVKAWSQEVKALRDVAQRTGNIEMMAAVDDVVRAAVKGDMRAFERIAERIANGEVSEQFYALANPSEFWAVNASRLVQSRAAEGWVATAKQWLIEFIEKIKDAFGLRSDAAVIRGLDAVLKSDGQLEGEMLSGRADVALQVTARNVEQPGKGVAQENLNGFEPSLRVRVPMGKIQLPAKPLVLTGTNMKNAARQMAGIDEAMAAFPDADKSPLQWSRMMAYAMATDDVPIPPYRFLADINSDGAFKSLSRLTKGQIEDANHGFENARLFREAYVNGELDAETTGKLFMWSFLSRGVSPYVQEGLFIDAFPGIDKWIKKAANGDFSEKDFDAYRAWASSVAPKGSGQPGSGATHNLNAFGELFLFKMSQRDENGVSVLQRLHNLMADPNMTGQQIRRWFLQNTEGVGIDNKVVSFTLLVAGFNDVMVLDRVQIRQLWDDGRFAGRNLYDGRKVDGKPVAGSALSEITYGARGLLIYEAIERALSKRIENLYTQLGRPQDASVGRYHWETWVADSQQEASHGTLDAILADAKGNRGALAEITAKEGEYGGYAYGARYGRDAGGQPYFLYTTPLGNEYRFTVGAFREFMEAVKSPKNRVIPAKFKVTEAGNAPWYEKAEVNRQALDELAQRYAGEPGAGEGAGAVRAPGAGEDLPDGAGRGADPFGADAIVAQQPDLAVPVDGGDVIPAARALAQADAEIAKAQQDSQGFDAAVACALRG